MNTPIFKCRLLRNIIEDFCLKSYSQPSIRKQLQVVYLLLVSLQYVNFLQVCWELNPILPNMFDTSCLSHVTNALTVSNWIILWCNKVNEIRHYFLTILGCGSQTNRCAIFLRLLWYLAQPRSFPGRFETGCRHRLRERGQRQKVFRLFRLCYHQRRRFSSNPGWRGSPSWRSGNSILNFDSCRFKGFAIGDIEMIPKKFILLKVLKNA